MTTIDEQIIILNKFCKKLNLEPQIKEYLYERYFKWAKDPVVKVYLDILNRNAVEKLNFNLILKNLNSNFAKYLIEETDNIPLIIATPNDFTNLRVYPNIILNKNSKDVILDLSAVSITCSNFIDAYQFDMTDPFKKEKWSTPERIDTRLNQYIDMPTARVLTRYVPGISEKYQDDQIRDIATKIDIARKPLTLLYADTPEQMYDMYLHNLQGSCMRVGYTKDWDFMEKHKITPASFYAYFPYTRGIYFQKNGKTVARCILYADVNTNTTDMGYPNFNKARNPQDEPIQWYYGHIYYESYEIQLKFLEALRSAGYLSINTNPHKETKGNHFVPPENYSFIIPGILKRPTQESSRDLYINNVRLTTLLESSALKNESIFCAPFPFFDNMDYYGSGWSAKYNEETHDFTLTYNYNKNNTPSKAVIPTNNRQGYIQSTDYIEKKCDLCGSTTPENNDIYNWKTSSTGELVCGAECFKNHNYILVHHLGGINKWTKDANPDKLILANDGTYFSTLIAAKEAHYYPLITIDAVYPEQSDIIVSYKENVCCIDLSGTRYRCRPLSPNVTCYAVSDIMKVNLAKYQAVIQYKTENINYNLNENALSF